MRILSGHHDPDAHEVVRESGKEGLPICGPGKGGAFRLSGIRTELCEVGLQIVDDGSCTSVSDFRPTA